MVRSQIEGIAGESHAVAVGGLLLGSLAHAQNPEPKPDMDKLLDKLTFTKEKASLPYRLLKPDGYDKDGKDRCPLVVFLHGTVGRGADNKKQLRSGVEEFVKDATRKKHPCFLAVPQCPPDKLWFNVGSLDTRGNLPLPKNVFREHVGTNVNGTRGKQGDPRANRNSDETVRGLLSEVDHGRLGPLERERLDPRLLRSLSQSRRGDGS